MSAPVWCADLAAAFWARAGAPPPFPRDLRPVALTFPLCVIDLPGVSVAAIRAWFRDLGLVVPFDAPDRPLRACLVAHLGDGFAFLDSGDDPAERRFSLAHELGHFLRDYLHPRETVLRRLGPRALDVLDGKRPPTPAERLHAILRNAPVGPFAHLMHRDETGVPLGPAERDAEHAADRLAFELLAPVTAIGDVADRDGLVTRLVDEFDLPLIPAARYAALLVPGTPDVRRVTRFLKR